MKKKKDSIILTDKALRWVKRANDDNGDSNWDDTLSDQVIRICKRYMLMSSRIRRLYAHAERARELAHLQLSDLKDPKDCE